MSLRTKTLLLGALAALSTTGIAVYAQTSGKDGRVADPAVAGQPAPAAGTAAAAPQAPVQPWVLNCSNQGTGDTLNCSMTQTIVARETNQRIISASIFRIPQTKVLRLQLGLPHGLDLPAGVSLWVDDQAKVTNPIKTADQNGSYSLFDISDDFLAAMKAGKLLNVGVTSVDGRQFTLQLSLDGFGASVARV